MKKTLFTLLISAFCFAAWAQTDKPVMTIAFSDSLKNQISHIIPRTDYTIRLSYQSTISPEGKLLKPLITHEEAAGTVEDNDFVVRLRLLILNAPVWKPGNSSDTPALVLFDIDIKKGKISITDKNR